MNSRTWARAFSGFVVAAGCGTVVSILAVARTPPAGQAAAAAFDLAAVENGGRVEWASGQVNPHASAFNLIAAQASRYVGWYSDKNGPDQTEEIVFSFFSHQSALVASVQINPMLSDGGNNDRPKDVEIWVSSQSPTAGFSRAGAGTLKKENSLQTIAFPPVEAKYVSVRIVAVYPAIEGAQPGGFGIAASKLKILEGARAGYTPILARNPELASVLKGVMPGAPAAAALAAALPQANGLVCEAPIADAPANKSTYAQSRNVLIIADTTNQYHAFEWRTSSNDTRDLNEARVLKGVTFTWVTPTAFAAAQLVAEPKIDTVITAQVCGINDDFSPESKKALLSWVAAGHKLIIQDSDVCNGTYQPAYSLLPYPFQTDNPRAAGQPGVATILENSTLASANPRDVAFIDTETWGTGNNDLGDSNVVVKYDPHWCGVAWAKTWQGHNGFALAYAHHGRGLIVYDGFDFDQSGIQGYDQLQKRLLLQPFDSDNLVCSQHLGDFIIAAKPELKSQAMAAARTYTYPLSILGTFGYTGRVTLDAGVTPADPAISVKLDRTAIDLTKIDEATASLTVTTAANASLTSKVISVRGRDATGKNNVLCLALPERKTGSVKVVSELRQKPPTKNLEIILDASGSMRTPLGAGTRWTTAQQVLKDVVSKLPKDFSVGLRVYGHTLPSTDPGTCRDSALVVPVGPLNPSALLGAAMKLAPRGETPLVYSILQTPTDLQDAGGGTVILITDGEESCKGDFAAAAQTLKGAGMNLTLNIVGFTLNNAPAKAALSGLAESTGGHYYGASSGDALARAVLLAAVDRLPYRVLDAAGKEVARGEAGVDDAHELAPGAYTVVVSAGDQDVRLPITVAVGQDLQLKASIKGDKLVIEK